MAAPVSFPFANTVFLTARDMLAVEVARTNPQSIKRVTRKNSGTAKDFDPVRYADAILKLFFYPKDAFGQDSDLPAIGNVIGKFPFSDSLQTCYPAGYRAYTSLVKVISEDTDKCYVDDNFDDEGVEVDDGSDYDDDDDSGDYSSLRRPQGWDSGFHSPSQDRKPVSLARVQSGATINLDQTHDCYRNCPVISINVRKLVKRVRDMLVTGFPDDRTKLMAAWQYIICVNRPAVNGRSIVEQMVLGGQLDVPEDKDCIKIGRLVEFRKRVSETPAILSSGLRFPEVDAWLISYEWLTMAHFVLQALEQARAAKMKELRLAREQ